MPVWDQWVHPLWPAREKHCLHWLNQLDPLKKTAYGNLNDPSQPLDLSWVSCIYGYSPNAQPGRNAMAHMIHQQWVPQIITIRHSLWPADQGQLSGDKDPHQAKDINQEKLHIPGNHSFQVYTAQASVGLDPELLTVSFGKIAYPGILLTGTYSHMPNSGDQDVCTGSGGAGAMDGTCGSPLKFPTWLVWNWQACSPVTPM